MNTKDRAVVTSLLQYMTEHHLTGSEEFRAAMVHFRVVTTYTDQQISDEAARILMPDEHNHFVDVHSFECDTPHGTRHTFPTAVEAQAFANVTRTRIDGIADLIDMAADLAPADPELVDALNGVEPSLPSDNQEADMLIMRTITGCNISFAGCVAEGEALVARLKVCRYHSIAETIDKVITNMVGNLTGISLETQRRRFINKLATIAANL